MLDEVSFGHVELLSLATVQRGRAGSIAYSESWLGEALTSS